MKRDPEIQKFIDSFSKKAFGKSQTGCKREEICPTCQKPVGKFRDALSEKEHLISGMCQKCQDSVW